MLAPLFRGRQTFQTGDVVRRGLLLVVVSFCVACGLLTVVGRRRFDDDEEDFSSFFDDPLDADDVRSLSRTLRVLTTALDAANVTYFMVAGTLLGSYRHHGRIPWDDDVDLTVRSADKMAVMAALEPFKSDYGLFHSGDLDTPYHWKFYPRSQGDPAVGGRSVPMRPFRWPFVDLLFFDENSTHVWNASPNLRRERWPRSAVFPLGRRPFDGLWLPAPCDTATVLGVNFDVDDCHSRDFSHRYDLPVLTGSTGVPCRRLTGRHPFVQRYVSTNGSNSSSRDVRRSRRQLTETLLRGNATVHRLTVVDGC